jgi:phosphoglycerol transferase
MLNRDSGDRFRAWGPLALLLAIVALVWCTGNGRWSPASWAVPTAYLEPDKGDVVHALAMMKAVGDGEFVPLAWKKVDALGAPNTANWNDWPLVEELLVTFYGLLGRLFGLFGGLNVGTIIAHLSAAAAFYVVARWEDCDLPWAFVAALAFGLAPFIFAQSPFHITTEYVWHVPLFLPIWRWIATEPGIVWGSRRFWFAIAVAFIAGLQSPYWTNILCQLTLLGAGIMYWRTRSWPAFRSAIAVIGAAAIAFALMNLDTWTYRLTEGPNPGALSREYKWMEIYGLKLVDLVIPPATHHSDAFAIFAIKHKIGDPARGIPPASPLQDEGSYLGIVGLLALGLLAWTAIADAVKGRANDIPLAAWQVLWIVLCFTTGGLNAILGAFGFTLFRTGQRYSIVILAIALLYAAQRLTAWQKEATGRTAPDVLRIGSLTAAAAISALILWDQVPRAPAAEQTAMIARQVAADREFTEKMEAALPANAMVFQLPVMDFPESPLPGIPSYDHFRPYLYSNQLRFSYGSMKGRERERWQHDLQRQLVEGATVNQEAKRIQFNSVNVQRAVDELQRLGFKAIYINRNGFPDRGRGLEEALLDLGFTKPPIRSAAGDLTCIILEK